ncbi:restriction endonuclease [Acinetobacter higginsii]|uniref:restriction endonuclease n=1 Tax=Acinetobacter higginsii TaxID=70347 RepID=UPI001F4AC974|nr:restriction endonuclease [Acinetobacter higginsii]MCH7294070.1 restriction endonuclease [Acinetobacter higginsii]
MKNNSGKSYEKFVQSLYQAILASDHSGLGGQKNIVVETNKLLTGNNGVEREFDIYWEFIQGAIIYKNIIECKDYNSRIKLEKIDALDSKLRDFPNLRGIFATTKGYQKGARAKALDRGIELLIIREQNEDDWVNKDGVPLLKKINFRANAIHPARITNFHITLPKDAVLPQSTAINGDILISNLDNGDSYTVYDLQNTLMKEHNLGAGDFEKEYIFKGKINLPDHEFLIEGFHINYTILEPTVTEISIDFSEKLIGVIEFLNQGRKAKIYEDFVNYMDD